MRRLLLTCLVALAPLGAQMAYKQPPAQIAQMLDAPPTPQASFSPDRSHILFVERSGLPSIAEIGAPYLRLAGVRVNPRTNGSWRENFAIGLAVRTGAAETRIKTPPGAKIAHTAWSHDSKRVAFTITGSDGIKLWVADAATGTARKLADVALNGALGAPCTWADDSHLACLTVPAGRTVAPLPPDIPAGPIVQETDGQKAPAATYEDLLASPHDEALFDFYFTSQVVIVALEGSVTRIGVKGVHRRAAPSPDGAYLLVETAHRPYSYQVPLQRFPSLIEVWDRSGNVVRQVADVPIQENSARGFDAVETGPRAISWRSDAPATLAWIEALDGGDPQARIAKHDHVVTLASPFTGTPTELIALEYRVAGGGGPGGFGGAGITWARADLAIVSESWRRTRTTRTWAINPSNPALAPRLLWQRSSEDRYGNPGRFELTRSAFGNVLLTSADGRYAYLTGAGASPAGDRPFLDRYNLTSGETVRLFQSEAPAYEEIVALLDREGSRFVTRRESKSDVPNYFIRDLAAKSLSALTRFKDPASMFAGVTSQFVTYKRPDGVELSATVYLPPGYNKEKDGPLPFYLWAYPAEFGSAQAASQVSGSPYRFTRPQGASRLFMLTQGYGVMDDPTMPIVGQDGKEPNDTYVEQLVASAQAAVDKIVEMGVADRDRIGVGGHSYGAFMTANLLAHSRIFRAGIAESGAYMRTLTPFGFQNEERTYWQATALYTRMSPFTFADSIRAPILLVHGMADDNQGTFPINSERMFAALKGNGATVRYVQLPAEPHGYRARESIGHTLAEEVAWLDKHVKPKPKVKA